LQSCLSEVFIWFDFKKDEKEEMPEHLAKELDYEIKFATKNNYVNKCSIEELTKLLMILSEETKKFEGSETEDLTVNVFLNLFLIFKNIKNSLQSAIMCLHVLTSKDLSKELLISEVVESVVDISKTLFRKYLFPYVDQLSDKKKIDSNLTSIINYAYQILSLFHSLISNVPLKEELTVVIADMTLSSIFVENLENIQILCIDIITLVYLSFG
jgi:hypothetical protein